MLIFVLAWLYIVLLSLPIGFAVVKAISKRTGAESLLPPDVLIITGLAVIAVLLSYISVFSKIGGAVNVVLSLFAIALWLGYRKDIVNAFSKRKTADVVISCVTLVVVLLFATQVPNWYDTELYHAQAIQWSSTYKVVPGLGNLHGRMAFNSHSFLLQSLFDVGQMNMTNKAGVPLQIYPLNGLLVALLLCRLVLNFVKAAETKNRQRLIFYFILLLITASAMQVTDNTSIFIIPSASSPVTDTFLFVFVLYVVILYMEYYESDKAGIAFLLSLLIFFLPTIKMSGLLFVAMLPFIFRMTAKNIALIFSAAVVILFPFFYRNYVSSGYLIYPLPSIDIFNPDWKMPLADVIGEKKWVESWAKIPGVNCDVVLSMPFSQWFVTWFNSFTAMWKVVLIANAISPLAIGWALYKGRKKYAVLYLVLFLSFLFWFISAPDYRFSLATLLLTFALLASEICFIKADFFQRTMPKPVVFVVLLILAMPWLRRGSNDIMNRLVYPQSLKSFDVVAYDKGTFKYFIPAAKGEDRCGDAAIPCTPYPKENLVMRGESLEDGFRIK